MKTLNNTIAVATFKRVEENKPKARGLDISDLSVNNLIENEVLIDSQKYVKGTKLYFRADILRQPFTKQRFNLNGLEFILVPEESIILVGENG